MSACLIYVTAASRDDALALGRAVVEAGLAACANVLDGATSVYRWQGEMREASEAILIVKTRTDRAEAAAALIRSRHGYDCPCILVVPVSGGNPDFLAWIAAMTGAEDT